MQTENDDLAFAEAIANCAWVVSVWDEESEMVSFEAQNEEELQDLVKGLLINVKTKPIRYIEIERLL
ncbi:hypothetical protein C4588_03645 [Candidatus Parcubacteria bacterium]|nr:MAG: hypothetical protein C4588_03645 [Candidatus Parcubacteria bacterium]